MGKIGTMLNLLIHDRRGLKRAVAINFSRTRFSHLFSDKIYLKYMYRMLMGRKLNLKTPVTFNEKLQWLKLYDRNPAQCLMVDKYAVKSYISERVGEEYIIPTLGVYDRFEDLDFNALPNQFVLKCTHDSGSAIICRDKSVFDVRDAERRIKRNLNNNLFWHGREWVYKDLKPRIIVEQYMKDETNSTLTDYKFYCFNGVPKFLYISKDMNDRSKAAMCFLTLDWELAAYERSDYKLLTEIPPKPHNFEHMIEIARMLSSDFDFVRVDLYEINKKVYFSELTFFPGAGFSQYKKYEHDLEIGNMLKLTSKDDK